MKTPRFSPSLLAALLLLWGSGFSAQAAETYVDLSAFFNQKAFAANGAGTGPALDAEGRWLDAATLPTNYVDGAPYPTVDGLTHFKFGPLRGAAPDALRVNGQTIPVPAGQYQRLQLAWLATDQDMIDLSRSLAIHYADGSADSVQAGPIANWFNSPAAFADDIVTFFDKSGAKYILNITPNVDDVNADGTLKPWVLEATGSALQFRPNSRFMDGMSALTYELDLGAGVTNATLGIDMWNDFDVNISADGGNTWTEVLNSFKMFGYYVHNGENHDIYNVDLSPFLTNNLSGSIQVRWTDANTAEGWGPQVFNVVVYTGKIVKYKQRKTTPLDAARANIYLDFLTDGSQNEQQYIFSDQRSQAPSSQGGRFADNDRAVTYQLYLSNQVRQAKVAINLAQEFVVSIGSGGTLENLLSFTPGKDDGPYLYQATGTAANPATNVYSRSITGSSVLIYYITNLPPDLTEAKLKIDMENNFVVSIAPDAGDTNNLVFQQVTRYYRDVQDGSNRKLYTVELAGFLGNNNPTPNNLYIRFADGSTNDTSGPVVFGLSISHSTPPGSFTDALKSFELNANSLVPYAGMGAQNKAFYTIDLAPFLTNASSNPLVLQQVLVRLTDETPSDGWGPLVQRIIVYGGNLVIRADDSAMAGLACTGGLPSNAYPYGANIVRREYSINPAKTLQSIALPTLVPGATSATNLFLLAATLDSAATTPRLSIARSSPNGGVTISWSGSGALQSASQVTGPWAAVPNQTNPMTVSPVGTQFYRVAQ